MRININNKTKYNVQYLSKFGKQLKKTIKQGKDIEKIEKVITDLANGNKLDEKYKDHKLINDNHYKDCRECHIEPDLLLVYKYHDNDLLLFMIGIGSHSELFK